MQSTHAAWPVSAFEHYMLADDRPDFAMTCFVRCRFAGHFDRLRFESAWREAVVRHPMTRALVRGPRWGRRRDLVWYLDPNAAFPAVRWRSANPGVRPGSFPSDPRRGTGFLLWLDELPEETELLFQFHHAVCDGAGVFGFLEDLLLAYDHAGAGGGMTPRVLDPTRFERRDTIGLDAAELKARLPLDVEETRKFFRVLPAPVRRPKHRPAGLDRAPDLAAIVRRVLSEEDLRALSAAGKRRGATLNDALLRDFFLALDDWNGAQAPGAPRPSLRLAMPMDLRLPDDSAMSAANLVSMVFLTRSARELADRDVLLASIAAETARAKRHRMGITLIRVVRALGAWFAALVLFFRLPLCSASAVLTNLGRPFSGSGLLDAEGRVRSGSTRLLWLESIPPLRRRTRVAVSVNTYGGKLRLTLHYDSTVFGAEHAEEMLERYLVRLRQTARI